jgi:hypothetical protein
MNIERKHLIDLCDKFLSKEIGADELSVFSMNALKFEDDDWNDNIISEVIFAWSNELINFPINDVNVKLWRNKLENKADELLYYNNWDFHIEKQKEICEKYNSKWKPISRNLKIGVSVNLDIEPLNGLRHKSENGKVFWYIWSGKYSEDENFFKPICAEHLLQRKPKIVDYLGLDDGFRFLIDGNGYEDVWFDENLIK